MNGRNDEDIKSWEGGILTGTPSTVQLIQSIENDEILLVPDNVSHQQNHQSNFYLDDKQITPPLFPLNINSMNDLHKR